MTKSELYTLIAMADAIAFYEYDNFYGIGYALETTDNENEEINLAIQEFVSDFADVDTGNSNDYVIEIILRSENANT